MDPWGFKGGFPGGPRLYFSSSYQGLPGPGHLLDATIFRAPHVAIIVQKDVFGPQGDLSIDWMGFLIAAT